jgi:hypothetical protein
MTPPQTLARVLIRIRLALVAAGLLVCSAVPVAAGTVTLAWDPNPETDIAGYVVFYGTSSGQYATSVDVGNQTFFQFTEPYSTTPYYFAVRAYNQAGSQSELSAEVSTANPATTLELTGMTSSVPAPQAPGTSVTFSASVSGGVSPAQFKWLVFDGAVWQTSQSWSTSNSFTWRPTTANANYRVGVWARSATSTADAADNPSSAGQIPFPISQPLTLTSLSASLPAPQPVGTLVTFSAAAAGGTAPYQYKWLVSNGSAWSVAQDWSASNSFAWTPTVANANYTVGVWVRSAGSTLDAPENADAGSSIPFPISGSVALTSLTANKAAPQIAGSKIQFTATASGASAYQYKWMVFDGLRGPSLRTGHRATSSCGTSRNRAAVDRERAGRGEALQTTGASMAFPIWFQVTAAVMTPTRAIPGLMSWRSLWPSRWWVGSHTPDGQVPERTSRSPAPWTAARARGLVGFRRLDAKALDEMLRGTKVGCRAGRRLRTSSSWIGDGYYAGERADYPATSEVLTDAEVEALVADLTAGLSLLTGGMFERFSAITREPLSAGALTRVTRPNGIVVGRYRGVQNQLKTIGLGGRASQPDGTITAAAILLDAEFDRTSATRRLLRMHELGHALGYNHVQSRVSIMNPHIGPEPTEFDRRAALVAFRK